MIRMPPGTRTLFRLEFFTMSHTHFLARSLPLLILCLGATACASAAPATDEPGQRAVLGARDAKGQHIELDPVLIRPGKDGKPGQAIQADEVFERANEAYQARRYEEAADHYATIITYFQESRFYRPALFNAGLVYEKLERWEVAAAQYERILEEDAASSDAKDAFYRLAHVRAELGDWDAIDGLMTQVMLRGDLEHFDRMEAHLRRSTALLELGKLGEARDGFYTMVRLNREASGADRLADSTEFMVQGRFGLGRTYHQMVLGIPLVLPPQKMGEDLQEKAELFLKAQTSYIQALREHHAQWSVAAGYMIGKLYEDFYLDILAAEIPDDLTAEQTSLYFEELRKQLRPLMVRAIKVYEKNLSLSKRIVHPGGQDNRWVDASSAHLGHLKAYLNDPFTQRRAERLVLQGKPLDTLWNPVLMASDAVSEALESAHEASNSPKSPTRSPISSQPTPAKTPTPPRTSKKANSGEFIRSF